MQVFQRYLSLSIKIIYDHVLRDKKKEPAMFWSANFPRLPRQFTYILNNFRLSKQEERMNKNKPERNSCVDQKSAETKLTLIPLDKNLGIGLIGVSEVLKPIIGKTISTFLKEEIDGHSAGAEATIYIYTPWPRFLMMMVQTESCWLTATSKLLSLKCPYHQHVQKFLEIVHLWRGRDLLPGRDNTGWPSSARWCAINTSILIQGLRAHIPEVKQVP